MRALVSPLISRNYSLAQVIRPGGVQPNARLADIEGYEGSGVTTRRAPLVIKRMGPARAALTAGAATTVLTITFVAALVSFTQTQTASAIRSALARPDNLAITMSGSLSARQQPQARAAIRGDLRRAFGQVPFTLFGSLRVDGLALRGDVPASRAGAGGTRQIATVIAADALAAHATLIDGRWPSAAAAGRPVPVAVSAQAAASLGVSAGKVFTLRSPYDHKDATLRVSGIFRPDDPAAPYWRLDPLDGKGIQRAGGFTTYGPLFTTVAAMQSGPLSATLADWVAVPRSAAGIATTGLQPLSTRLSSALGELTASTAAGNPVATSPLPALLSRLSAAVLISRSLLLIGLLELLVLAAATLTLMGRALAGERRAETALLRARGGAERQLVRLGAAEGTLLVAPAVLIGPVLGIWLAGRLAAGRVHLAAGAAAAGALPGAGAGIWLIALAIAVVSLSVMLIPSVRAAVSPIAVATMRGRQHAVGAASRAGADLALVALAAAACWELAHTSVALTVAAGGQLSLDPVLVAAPVLAAPACSVLILRTLPLAARLADRSAARGRQIVLPLASWSIGRRPLRHAGPLLITVISLATAVLAVSQYQTSRQAARDLAAFTTGSDYRVDLPYGPLPLGDVDRMTGLKGASTVMPVVRGTATLSDNVTTATVLGLTGAKAASTVLLRADLAKEPLAKLSKQIAPAAAPPGAATPPGISAVLPGRVLPGRPERISVTATLSRGRGLGAPELQLQIRDGAGLYYLIAAGSLPADGRPHTLIADLGPGDQAAYPLRLAGVQVLFTPPSKPDTGVLRIGPVRVTNTGSGPFRPAALRVRHALPATMTRFPAGPNGTPQGADFAQLSWLRKPPVIPAIATSAFLAATRQRVGSVVSLSVSNVPLKVRIVASVSAFPTIPAAGGGLILDTEPLQQALTTSDAVPLPATEWWLRAARAPDFRGIAPGLQVTSRTAVAAAVIGDPFDVDVRLALAAIAAAAVILAIAGFAVSAAAARERRPELALLDALGMPRRQLTRMLRTEQVLLAVPSAAAGVALGAVLAHLIVPALILTPTGGVPALPVIVTVPWLIAGAMAAVIAAFPVIVAPLTGRASDTVTVLRQGAQE
jgi:FtsX-like permease family